MKHQDLRDKIEGSFLKKEYLEAFLLQGTYIEAILKLFLDYSYFKEVSNTSVKTRKSKMVSAIEKRLDRYSLFQIIEILNECELISDQHRSQLDDYRLKRNKVVHDLFREMLGHEEFELELKKTYEKGSEVMKTPWFNKMVKTIEEIEESILKDLSQEKREEKEEKK